MSSNLVKSLNRMANGKLTDDQLYRAVQTLNPNLPEYKAGTDFSSVGRVYAQNTDLFSQYTKGLLDMLSGRNLNGLPTQTALFFTRLSQNRNPLRDLFYRGQMPYGSDVQAMIWNNISVHNYLAPEFTDSKTHDPYRVNLAQPETDTIQRTEDVSSLVTIEDTDSATKFQTVEQFNQFFYGSIYALANGFFYDEYKHTMVSLSKPIASGDAKIYNYAQDLQNVSNRREFANSVIEDLIATTEDMQYWTDEFNSRGVSNPVPVDKLVILTTNRMNALVTVNALSAAFNKEDLATGVEIRRVGPKFFDVWQYTKDHTVTQADLDAGYIDVYNDQNNSLGTYQVGDVLPKGSLAAAGATDAVKVLDGSKIGFVIMDRDALQMYDQLPLTMTAIANPYNRYTNITGNKKTKFVFVPGLNFVAITFDAAKPEGYQTQNTLLAQADDPVSLLAADDKLFDGVANSVAAGSTITIPMGNFAVSDLAKTLGVTKVGIKSSNPDVATVSAGDVSKQTYTLTGVKEGKTTLTVTKPDGSQLGSGSLEVTVTAK